jgi:hypothetical protein
MIVFAPLAKIVTYRLHVRREPNKRYSASIFRITSGEYQERGLWHIHISRLVPTFHFLSLCQSVPPRVNYSQSIIGKTGRLEVNEVAVPSSAPSGNYKTFEDLAEMANTVAELAKLTNAVCFRGTGRKAGFIRSW